MRNMTPVILALRGLSAVQSCLTGPEGTVPGEYIYDLSDGGATWPVRKLLMDGKMREMNGGAWTEPFVTDRTHTEPVGYLSATQTPNCTIRLLSNLNHYRFNLQWLEQPAE